MEFLNIFLKNVINKDILLYIAYFFFLIFVGNFFGSPGIIILLIIGLFLNTSANSTIDISPYSILNPGFQRMMGDLDIEQIEEQLFNRQNNEINNFESDILYSDNELYAFSRYSNKKCPLCNSGKKYKRCCGSIQRK